MTKEEEYQRRFLQDELNALSGYGSRRLELRHRLVKPMNVRKAEHVVAQWNNRVNRAQFRLRKQQDEAFAGIRKAIAFREYKQALKLIEELKRKARAR